MNTNVIILAAGKGTRMKSSKVKVLHRLGNKTLVQKVIELCKNFNPSKICLVVGHQAEQVIEETKKFGNFIYVEQKEQLGTGHAIQTVLKTAPEVFDCDRIIILLGDAPFLDKQSIEYLKKIKGNGFLGMKVNREHSYGRILGSEGKEVGDTFIAKSIKEHKDCSPKERKINIVNSAIYSFESEFLKKNIKNLKKANAQGEYYLTDVVQDIPCLVVEEIVGVNDMTDLTNLENDFYYKRNQKLLKEGVRIQCPYTVRIDEDVEIEPDVEIHQNTTIKASKKMKIGSGTVIMQGNFIEDTNIGKNCKLLPNNMISNSTIKNEASIGPFAHLRPDSVIGDKVKVGNFVEIKKSTLGKGSKVSHLSYVGDGEVGEEVNIGCGFITCNYDGFQKHKTTIKDGAFIGSDVQANAPLTIGKNSFVASGTTLTRDVPDGALAIARTKQENKEGYAELLKKRFKAKKDKRS